MEGIKKLFFVVFLAGIFVVPVHANCGFNQNQLDLIATLANVTNISDTELRDLFDATCYNDVAIQNDIAGIKIKNAIQDIDINATKGSVSSTLTNYYDRAYIDTRFATYNLTVLTLTNNHLTNHTDYLDSKLNDVGDLSRIADILENTIEQQTTITNLDQIVQEQLNEFKDQDLKQIEEDLGDFREIYVTQKEFSEELENYQVTQENSSNDQILGGWGVPLLIGLIALGYWYWQNEKKQTKQLTRQPMQQNFTQQPASPIGFKQIQPNQPLPTQQRKSKKSASQATAKEIHKTTKKKKTK